MAKKRKASKKNFDVIYVERVTAKNPFDEPKRPDAWNGSVNERIVDY